MNRQLNGLKMNVMKQLKLLFTPSGFLPHIASVHICARMVVTCQDFHHRTRIVRLKNLNRLRYHSTFERKFWGKNIYELIKWAYKNITIFTAEDNSNWMFNMLHIHYSSNLKTYLEQDEDWNICTAMIANYLWKMFTHHTAHVYPSSSQDSCTNI